MKISKFINDWEKTRKRGVVLYILRYAILVPLCGSMGKVIGEYTRIGILFRPFIIQDYISMIFLCFIGTLIGMHSWKHNEYKYKEFL